MDRINGSSVSTFDAVDTLSIVAVWSVLRRGSRVHNTVKLLKLRFISGIKISAADFAMAYSVSHAFRAYLDCH